MRDYAEIFATLLSDLGTIGDVPFLSSDMSVYAVHAYQLRKSFFKKLNPGSTNTNADVSALKKFQSINARMPVDFEFSVADEIDSLLWDYFRGNLAKCLDFDVSDPVNFDLEFVRDHFAGGPGASLGCDSESFYTKFFASKLTATHPFLVSLYRAAIECSPTWSAAERHRNERFGMSIVKGNKLFFVPKTTEISRTCCTEPFCNMLLQKAIGAFLEYRLRRHFGVSLSLQPDYNRELARLGSSDGSFGTIDLSSASDSIAWSLVEKVVPTNLLGWLRIARSPATILPDGSEMGLGMISTMGNGFTFPLQTIIFASAVRAVYQLMGYTMSCPRTQFGVFGDDIIVRRETYDVVIRLLTKLGFEVNGDKSFNSGPFRESCGHDYFQGHYVRGVYITGLETVPEVYSAINRLVKWSAVSGIRLPKTVGALRRLVVNLPVPPSSADHEGIQTPFQCTIPKVTDSYWYAFRKRIVKVRRRKVPYTSEESKQLGYRDFNPYGWEVTLLGGYARGEEVGLYPGHDGLYNPACREGASHWVSLREHPGARPRTKVVRTSIPFWDWPGPIVPKHYTMGGWEAAYRANLE